MNIQFVNNSAEQIFNRVINHTIPEAREEAQSLFSLAAKEDGQDTLSEEEAKNLEEALKRYDRGLLLSFGIGYYDKNEIDNALAEYQTWEECQSNFFSASDETAVDSFKEFIRNYPGSNFAPEAYYRLGHLYYIRLTDYDNAIAVYEILASLYPDSIQTSRAMEELTWLYNRTGQEALSYLTAQAWLTRESYAPRNFYGPASSYGDTRSWVSFNMADYLLGRGKADEATAILEELTLIGSEYYARLAKGALGDLNFSCNEAWSEYWRFRLNRMNENAQYFLQEKHDLEQARKIYEEMLPLATMADDKYNIRQARAAIADMDLRGMIFSADAVAAVDELRQTDVIASLLEYYGLISDPEHRDTVNGIPGDIYLLGMLLKSCWDVAEVRLMSFSKIDVVDGETKTPADGYLLAYRNGDGWNFIDLNNYFDYCFQNRAFENFWELNLQLAMQTGRQFYSVAWEKPDHLFAGSLDEFRNWPRLSPYDLVVALQLERLSDSARKMVQDIKTQINGTEEKHQWLISFARAYSLLPKYHFDQLRVVNFDFVFDENIAAGEYNPLYKAINLKSSTSSTAVHELAHHWDMTLARGQNGADQSAGDPSLIFYQISWDAWSENSQGREFIRACNNRQDKDACALAFIPGQGWRRKPGAGLADFVEAYGLADGFEDLTTSAVSYTEGTGNLTRGKVRQEMDRGNFEPAAKYLFNKYVRSFDPSDGLCFEYNVTPLDPPLSLAEVKAKIESWLACHPNSISPSTLTAIEQIEQEYLRQMALFV